LPGLVEGDDDGLYVVKFHGAGQGPRALVAEWVGGEIARRLGLTVPELVGVDLDPALGDAEPHQEIQDLVRASGGLNLGLDFLPGAVMYNPAAATSLAAMDPATAAGIVWLDGLITNPDRTAQNPNLLVWHGRTWLIDHANSRTITADSLPQWLVEFPQRTVVSFGGLDIRLVLTVAVVVIVALQLALGRLRWGRWVYAVGSNPDAARQEGLPTERITLGAFAMCGALSGLAGFMFLSRFGTITVSAWSVASRSRTAEPASSTSSPRSGATSSSSSSPRPRRANRRRTSSSG